MQSHQYALSLKDVVQRVAPIVAWVAVFPLCLHALHALGWLPDIGRERDPDQTILAYQSRAARAPSNARVILIGDSSCLTSIDASRLGPLLPGSPEVINLALFSGVSLRIYAEAAADFIAAHPRQAQAVVLLVTAGKLQDETGTEYFDELWNEIHHGAGADQRLSGFRDWTGLRWMEERVLPAVFAEPLRGGMAQEFGVAEGILDQLRARHGSGVHLARYRPPPRPQPLDGPVTEAIRRESREARAMIPVPLVAGIMSLPESYPTPDYASRRDGLLEEWNRDLQADVLLTGLPTTLPDAWFANESHINGESQERFTRLFAEVLAPALEQAAKRSAR
jgi:hypothetical protein